MRAVTNPEAAGGPLQALAGILNLDAPQRARLQTVLQANGPRIQAIGVEAAAKVDAVLNDIQVELAPYLTPKQREVLESIEMHANLRANAGTTR